MKKMFLIGAFLCSVFAINGYSRGFWFSGGNNCGNSCPEACPSDQRCGGCYCQYVHYEPRYYNKKRCVEEQYNCPKKCCRMVPQQYEVTKCRMVPQYYKETRCRQVPEYYEVQECRTRKKVICEPQCEYVPRYYWKYECNENAPCAPRGR